MTEDSKLVQQRDAADYSARCMHILCLDDVLTAALENEDSVNDADRDALVGIAATLEREFDQVVYSIDRIEELALRAARSRSRVFRSLPGSGRLRAVRGETASTTVYRATDVIRTIGPGEAVKLLGIVTELTSGNRRPGADLPRQVRGALMIISACLLMVLAHASANATDGGGLYTIAGALFSTGLPLLDSPDE